MHKQKTLKQAQFYFVFLRMVKRGDKKRVNLDSAGLEIQYCSYFMSYTFLRKIPYTYIRHTSKSVFQYVFYVQPKHA
jgi:hypothetical protein